MPQEPEIKLEAEPVQPKRRGRPKKIQTEEPAVTVVKRGRGRPSRSIEEKLGRKISLNIDGELKAYLDWVQREYKVNMAQYIRSLVTADMRHNEEYRGK